MLYCSEFGPRVRKIPWRRARLPAPVSVPGKLHGQRGYNPRATKESDTTQQLNKNHNNEASQHLAEGECN